MIRTGVLSKRWPYQWTRVPLLIFDFYHQSRQAHGEKDFSPFIDSALVLYDCPKVSKFQLQVVCQSGQYNRAIRFAVLRNVKELILSFLGSVVNYKLPKVVFSNDSLARLEAVKCLFVSDMKVNFKSLKLLHVYRSFFGDGVMENVLCGSPVLESLKLSNCHSFKQLAITSKSLKSLFLAQGLDFVRDVQIEIECPKLEKIDLGPLDVVTFRLKLPSLICGTLHHSPSSYFNESLAKQIFNQFPHVKNLTLSGKYVKTALQVGGLRAPLNCKSLTLGCYRIDMQEIKYALCNSPQLERLVIDLRMCKTADLTGLNNFEETFWHSNGMDYACLASHLKTVDIISLSKKNHRVDVVLQFVEFLFKNARALEKMVIKLGDGGTQFLTEVSQKLLKFPRCSPHGIVEVL